MDETLNTSTSSVLMMHESGEWKTIPIVFDQMPTMSHEGVVIQPNFVQFDSASEGIVRKRPITIINTGTKPAFVRILETKSIAFQVRANKTGNVLYPGLSMTTKVTYNFKRPSLLHTIIPIEINGKQLDYRVICTLGTDGIYVQPKSVNFGTIDLGYSSGFQSIFIYNDGGKSTRFSIDVGKNSLKTTVKPLRGIIESKTSLELKVGLIGLSEGTFYSEFRIKSTPDIRVPVRVTVIIPRWDINYPKTTGDFGLIDFPKTVENTRKFDRFTLKNHSSQVSSYVVLAEVDHELTFIEDIDRNKYPVHEVFQIRPTEGRLMPFQSIVFEVSFNPTTKLRRKFEQRLREERVQESFVRDFMAFVQIVRVHCTETEDILRIDANSGTDIPEDAKNSQGRYLHSNNSSSSLSSSSRSTNSTNPPQTIRLCLYGDVEFAQLQLFPDVIYFGDLNVGENAERVITIKNSSLHVPLMFSYVHRSGIFCSPKTKRLDPSNSIEILVKLQARENLPSSFNLLFDAFADSYEPIRKTVIEKKIATYKIQCIANVSLKLGSVSSNELKTFSRVTFVNKENQEEYEMIEKILQFPNYKNTFAKKILCNVIEARKLVPVKKHVYLPLTPIQIYRIHIFPTRFNFGKVANQSSNYRYFTVTNQNEFTIMIRLISLSSKTIRFPEGDLMIIESGSTMRRSIEFRAHNVGEFNSYFDYIINNNHSYEIILTANVVYKQLNIDRHEINLRKEWFKEERYQPLGAIIKIKNKLNAKTSYDWEIPSTSGFKVLPMSASVRGNSVLYNYITYESRSSKSNDSEIVLKYGNNSYRNLALIYNEGNPKVEFIENSINLGDISLNLINNAICTLQNFDSREVMYEVETSSLIRGCQIEPINGIIPPRGIKTLQITCKFDACFQFTTIIRTKLNNRVWIDLQFNGRVIAPLFKFIPEQIDLMNCSTRLIQFVNLGTTLLTIKFRFEEYSDFYITFPDNISGNLELTVLPNKTIDFYLHFQPTVSTNHEFYLPYVVNEMIGPVKKDDPNGLKVSNYTKSDYEGLPNVILNDSSSKLSTILIKCMVLERIISLNKLSFKFHSFDNKLQDVVIIKNESSNETLVSIQGHKFDERDCPFLIRWSETKEPSINYLLKPNEQLCLTIEFHPKIYGTFQLEVPIFVNKQSDPCNILSFRGENPKNVMEVDKSDIYMTPGPVQVSIEQTLRLTAKYFRTSSFVTWKIIPNKVYNFDPLSINLINDNIIDCCCRTDLNAMVVFRSPFPGTWAGKIVFEDSEKSTSCTVNVYATADNSLLTTYSYWLNLTQKNRNVETRTSFPSLASSNTDTGDDDTSSVVYKRIENSISGRKGQSEIEIMSSNKSRISIEGLNGQERGVKSLEKIPLQLSVEKYRRYSTKSLHFHHTPSNNFELDKLDEKTVIAVEEWLYSNQFQYNFYPRLPEGMSIYFTNISSVRESRGSFLKKRQTNWSIFTVLESLLGTSKVVQQIGNPVFKSHNILIWIKSGDGKHLHSQPAKCTIQLLKYFIKIQIYGILMRYPLPENNDERIDFIIGLYKKLLTFLCDNGAYLIQVKVQFLLSYDDYVSVFRSIGSQTRRRKSSLTNEIDVNCELMSRESFRVRSRQCWLDVILQIYKSFVLSRIDEKQIQTHSFLLQKFHSRKSSSCTSTKLSESKSLRKSLEDPTPIAIVRLREKQCVLINRCEGETLLLLWLQYHYNEQIFESWMTTSNQLNLGGNIINTRIIEDFESDLSDSLVLIAVTIAYCPYLIDEYFNKLYIPAKTTEELLHNGICLISAWRKIRLGIPIEPTDIVYPNRVKMLMLVVHLFETLPSYIPKSKIKFNCPLLKTTVKELSISNPTNHRVNYLIQLIGPNSHFFSMISTNNIIHINEQDNTLIKIQFHARKIPAVRVCVIFCGQTIGSNMVKNQAFILEGRCDNLTIADTHLVKSKLYQVIDQVLKIKIPYSDKVRYEIWMTEDQPKTPGNLNISRWYELREKKIPRRLFINQNSIYINDDKKEANLSITIACFTPESKNYWLVFQSKNNDFIVRINSDFLPPEPYPIVANWTKKNLQCNCLIKIMIPARNTHLWECISEMFQKTLNSKEKQFWSKYFVTNIGLRLIHFLMLENIGPNSSEFVHIFHTKVTYKLTIDEKRGFLSLPKTLTIKDVRDDDYIQLTGNISPSTPNVHETILSLMSSNDEELRLYKITLNRD